MKISRGGCIGGAGSGPRIGSGIVPSASIFRIPAPDDHFTPSPNRGMVGSCRWRIDRGSRCPGVGAGIVYSAGVEATGAVLSSPNDYCTARPHCRVKRPRSGRIDRACRSPSVIATSSRVPTFGGFLARSLT